MPHTEKQVAKVFGEAVDYLASLINEPMPSAQTISERLDQIEQLVPRVRRALFERRPK